MGYCPFPALGRDTAVVLRHKGMRRARQACLRARLGTYARARAWVCLGRPVAIGLLGCSIKMARPVSRQRWIVLRRERVWPLVSLQSQACGPCRDKCAPCMRDRAPNARQKGFVAIKNFLSREVLQRFLSRQRNLCHDRRLEGLLS